jgi:hypothetical protein
LKRVFFVVVAFFDVFEGAGLPTNFYCFNVFFRCAFFGL